MAKLTPNELKTALLSLPLWQLEDDMLVRDFTFPDFVQTMFFVNKIAVLAEAANHHPDIDIRYDKVRLALISHDSGGLTKRDVSLAGKVDEAFEAVG